MTGAEVAAIPTMRTAAMEQVRVVGLAVRWEAMAMCAGLVLFLAGSALLFDMTPAGVPGYVDPSTLGFLAVLLGLVAPLGVWRGESMFGESELWSLPVDHARHARSKVVAGWIWLMALVAFALVSFALFAEVVGLTMRETRYLIGDLDGSTLASITTFPSVEWSPVAWQWLIPFTAATAAYLAASALLLGVKRPYYWAAGIWLALITVAEFSDLGAGTGRMYDRALFAFDLLGSGGSETGKVYSAVQGGERIVAWSRLPTMGSWATASLAWIAATGGLMWAASSRRREG